VSGIAYQLFGKRSPKDETAAIVRSFKKLRQSEQSDARGFDAGSEKAKAPEVRRSFDRLTRWTRVFNPALMREYQLAESLLRNPTDGFPIHDTMRHPWYRPLTEHPQWAAWGAILELAIRRVLAAHLGRADGWHDGTTDVEVVEHRCPTVLFPTEQNRTSLREPPVRRPLTIELATLRRRFARDDPRRLFAARGPVVWALQPETIPWWAHADQRRPTGTPDARTIWQWSAFERADWTQDDFAKFLGGVSLGRQQSA
jgi:hypothetical protein